MSKFMIRRTAFAAVFAAAVAQPAAAHDSTAVFTGVDIVEQST